MVSLDTVAVASDWAALEGFPGGLQLRRQPVWGNSQGKLNRVHSSEIRSISFLFFFFSDVEKTFPLFIITKT